MSRSRFVRSVLSSDHFTRRSLHPRSFSLSYPIQEDRPSFFKRKLATVGENIPGEQLFPTLASHPPSPVVSNGEGGERDPAEMRQREEGDERQRQEGEERVQRPRSVKDGAEWRTPSTQDPRKIDDVSRLYREDGSPTINPIYLRDSCQCSLCVDGSTLQRKFLTAHIPLNIEAIFHERSDHDKVRVKWKNDIPGYPPEHQSVYSTTDLQSMTLPPPDSCIHRKRHHWDRAVMEERASVTTYADFVKDPEAFKAAMTALHRDGLIFINEVDAYEQAVGRMARRIGPVRNSFYGSTWDVKSEVNSKNVAYTNQHLGFHMDLLYMANPPGYQLLHCLKNSCSGGESRFADSFFAARRLRRSNKKYYKMLTKYQVQWAYENAGHFYRQIRPTFQPVSTLVGVNERWRRFLAREETQDADADLAYVNWSPPFQGRLHHNPGRPGNTKVFVKAAQLFDRLLNADDMVVELKMEAGTCVIFENRRIVHARNAFDTTEGERWLRGAYVDEDAFWSRCREIGADQYDTSSLKEPEINLVRNVLGESTDDEVS